MLGYGRAGLSIGFEVDGDILKVDGYGGQRPPHKRVWKVLEFYSGIFQDWNVLEIKATGPGKIWKSVKLN